MKPSVETILKVKAQVCSIQGDLMRHHGFSADELSDIYVQINLYAVNVLLNNVRVSLESMNRYLLSLESVNRYLSKEVAYEP